MPPVILIVIGITMSIRDQCYKTFYSRKFQIGQKSCGLYVKVLQLSGTLQFAAYNHNDCILQFYSSCHTITVITIVNYDRETFIVQASGVFVLG
jgi:hypothetical protein